MIKNEKGKINGIEFNRILIKIFKNNLEGALYDFSIYLKKYPRDICAYLYYVDVLLKIGEIKKAEKILNSSLSKKIELQEDKERFFYTKIKLLIYQESFLECYKFINKNMKMFGKRKYDKEILLLLKKKIGKIVKDDRQKVNYKGAQVLDYNEGLAREHILENQFNFKYSGYRFNKGFNLLQIFKKIRTLVPNNMKYIDNFIFDKYIFRYDNCGMIYGNHTDYFIVYTNMNTNQIIEMYPYENRENLPYIDLNYLKNSINKTRIRL